MNMDKNRLEALRNRYPVGTMIQLDDMTDDPNPVEAGTHGTVRAVDALGTVHVEWDNGRTLGLVPGVDRFHPVQPELYTLRLYMPLTAELCEYNDWGDLEDSGCELSGRALLAYEDEISCALIQNQLPEEAERGLMHWYHDADSVNDKVHSVQFQAEARDRQLWGVAECRVSEALTPAELDILKDYITGQASDGWGEGFEQQEIKVDGGELYVHLWNSRDWYIETEQERFAPKLADGLPEICMSVLPGSGALICIRRGQTGYYPSEWETGDPEKNRELADYANSRQGITKEQEQAMLTGSMFGWAVPGADQKNYDQDMPKMEMTVS